MAQPFTQQVVTAITAIQNAMLETWDPFYVETAYRMRDVAKFFKPTNKPWPKGAKYHVPVEDTILSATRFIGNMSAVSSNVGVALPTPDSTIGFNEWQVDQADLMGMDCPVRYEWKSGEILNDDIIGNAAEKLSRESMNDLMQRVDMALVGRQTGAIAAITNVQRALAASYATSYATSTDIRAWLKYGSAAQLNKGDRIELRTASGTTSCDGDMSSSASTNASEFLVQNVGFARGASGVYGYLDLKGVDANKSSRIASSGFTYYVLRSKEYSSTYKPGSAPSTASSGKCPYGFRDWFIAENASPGTLYNLNRATLGNQWACPIIVTGGSAGSELVITLEVFDSLLMQLAQKHLNVDKLTNLVVLAGPNMVNKLIQLTGSASRRIDSAANAKASIYTNYGFEGVVIHSPFLTEPVAVQPVRGMAEDVIYVIQPGVCQMVTLGRPEWLPYDSNGAIWHGEGYYDSTNSALARTTVFRADRIWNWNSLIRVPRFCGAAVGYKPD